MAFRSILLRLPEYHDGVIFEPRVLILPEEEHNLPWKALPCGPFSSFYLRPSSFTLTHQHEHGR